MIELLNLAATKNFLPIEEATFSILNSIPKTALSHAASCPDQAESLTKARSFIGVIIMPSQKYFLGYSFIYCFTVISTVCTVGSSSPSPHSAVILPMLVARSAPASSLSRQLRSASPPEWHCP